MAKVKRKSFVKQLLWECIGSMMIAVGIYNFALSAGFPMTGFSGISIILLRLFQIPVGLSTVILNIPVALLCYHLLGKYFFVSSIRCMVLTSIFVDYAAPLLPAYQGSRLLAALCTGVIAGLGYTFIYMQNSSTGGMDFIVLSIKAKKPYLSMGRIIFLCDLVIILTGGFIFRDIDGVIYGLIVSFLFTVVLDKMMYGMNAGKLALIVTDHGEAIAKVIEQSSDRGATLLKAMGGYSRKEKQVVLCVCNNKEMYFVLQAVKAEDPESFIIISESNEVHGEGFHTIKLGERYDKSK